MVVNGSIRGTDPDVLLVLRLSAPPSGGMATRPRGTPMASGCNLSTPTLQPFTTGHLVLLVLRQGDMWVCPTSPRTTSTPRVRRPGLTTTAGELDTNLFTSGLTTKVGGDYRKFFTYLLFRLSTGSTVITRGVRVTTRVRRSALHRPGRPIPFGDVGGDCPAGVADVPISTEVTLLSGGRRKIGLLRKGLP